LPRRLLLRAAERRRLWGHLLSTVFTQLLQWLLLRRRLREQPYLLPHPKRDVRQQLLRSRQVLQRGLLRRQRNVREQRLPSGLQSNDS
jgi:hypothetical protein